MKNKTQYRKLYLPVPETVPADIKISLILSITGPITVPVNAVFNPSQVRNPYTFYISATGRGFLYILRALEISRLSDLQTMLTDHSNRPNIKKGLSMNSIRNFGRKFSAEVMRQASKAKTGTFSITRARKHVGNFYLPCLTHRLLQQDIK